MEDLVFSPGGSHDQGRSPRLRFRGGLSQLVGLNEKMNRTLSELKEGQFDHAKGHEAVQALQSKLYRLQDHFDVPAMSNDSILHSSLLQLHFNFFPTGRTAMASRRCSTSSRSW